MNMQDTLKDAQLAVRDFMVKHNNLATGHELVPGRMEMIRIGLIVEETAELMEARTRLARADALGDLLYVVLGAATFYDIDIAPIFWEIHRSNMTKAVSSDPRVKDKGDSYVAPNLAPLIKRGLSD